MMPIRYKTSTLQRLDAMFLWTGLPQRIPSDDRLRARPRRRLRWISLVALVTETAGIAWIFTFPGKYGVGYAAITAGGVIGSILPGFGPLRALFGEEADERESNLRRNAYLVGFGTVSAAAIFGIFLLAFLSILGNWPHDILFMAMIALAAYLLYLFSIVPTLYASWTLPKPVDDDA
jgi:MFS family permease